MSTIGEYKEFFLRITTGAGTASPDKELNFPIKEIVVDENGTPSQEYNRFLKKHFPSERVYRKLFESITFKLNSEDTASIEEQGLVRIAYGHNIVNRKDTDDIVVGATSRKFTTVVVPSTLPKISAGTGIDIDVKIRKSSDNSVVPSIPVNSRELYYLDYEIINTLTIPDPPDPVVVPEFINASYKLDFVNFDTLTDDPDDAQYAVLGTHTIAANKVTNDNSFINYDVHWIKADNGAFRPAIEVFIGNSLNITNCLPIALFILLDGNTHNGELISTLNLKIDREAVNGYFSKAISTHYGTAGITIDDVSNGFGLLNIAAEHLYPVSFKVDTTGGNPSGVIDWANIMYVHFRVRKDGDLVAQAANRVRITGYNTNPI